MIIKQAKFVKGIVGHDPLLEETVPMIAFIGRSNVGKSSLINALTNTKIAKTSSSAGSTQEINAYNINSGSRYFLDLPGYGYARASGRGRIKIADLIDLYLFQSDYIQKKVVLVIDINTGMTPLDRDMFEDLKDHNKDIIIAVSKVDKLNQSEIYHQLKKIKEVTGEHLVIPFSSTKKTRINTLIDLVLE